MSGDKFLGQPDHATPLLPGEMRYLRLPIMGRQQLNAAEAANVAAGQFWGAKSRKSQWTEEFLRLLHKRMFGDVWKWAGRYRKHDVNIGDVPAWRVETDVRSILDDAGYWAENATYPPHELAVRLHHRLVFVHPFVNGNGRCTRMLADIVLIRTKAEPLTWGGVSLVETGVLRADYISALQAADANDIGPLLRFAQRN